MKGKWLLVSLSLMGLTLALIAGLSFAQGAASQAIQGGAPTVVSYQGEVHVDGTPYTGDGYFKFAVVNAPGSTTHWSNDGTSTGGGEPTAAVQLAVSDGRFGLLLGDTTLAGMPQALTADVFEQPDRYLRVWFGTSSGGPFDLLTPDTRIAAIPYALQAQEAVDADTVDGLHANQLGTHYQNVVVVAKSGGDYTSVQAAIDSIGDAAGDNAYLVWVAPGVYAEQVTMMPYVHLQGAGQEVTVITSTASSSDWPPTQATLVMASDVSLRDLTVGNSGAGDTNVALLATAGMTRTLASDVMARALGGGVTNMAIVLSGSGTGVTLQQVSALAENGNSHGIGLLNMSGAAAVLRGGTFTGRGGEVGRGIFTMGSGTTLEAMGVSALGENGSNLNVGLGNYDSAAAVLRSGVFTGRGGNQTGGVGNSDSSTLTAEDITVLAENGSDNYGLGNYKGAAMTVRGAAVTARGGAANYALSNELTVTMEAENVTALAENGSSVNYGMWNVNNAQATVRGGSFTGRGGTEAWGIYNDASGTRLDAEGVTALGENASDDCFGLSNTTGAAATVRGGSFTGRGAISAWGIYNAGSDTTLETESVTALGEDGNDNHGLINETGAAATLRGGSFTGRGGSYTRGIYNYFDATLEAESVTALAENGSNNNYGLYNFDAAAATVRGGSFTARGGTYARGIYNSGSGTTLEADGVTTLGDQYSIEGFGLFNSESAEATLRGGSFTARGGSVARGIYSNGSGTVLEASSVAALGENGSNGNYGLYNLGGARMMLRGGSSTARGGLSARGIHNGGISTSLQATGVAFLGENGNNNWGLYNTADAAAMLHGGSCIGRGGIGGLGIYNSGSSTTLEAESVTALGEKGSSINYGLHNGLSGTANLTLSMLDGATYSVYRQGGSVTLSNSRLEGNSVNGTITCTLVTRGITLTTDGTTCP